MSGPNALPPRQDLREAPRYHAHASVAVRQRGRTAVIAHIADLSDTGCRVNGAICPTPGTPVWVRLPGLETRGGRIVWSSTEETGIAFEERLHPAVTVRFTDDRGAGIGYDPHPAGHGEEGADPLLSRRQQVLAGQLAEHGGPLSTRKRPVRRGLAGAIVRNYSRRVDHRYEPRFPSHETDGPATVQIGDVEAVIGNVSSSGLMVTLPAAGLTIGMPVSLEFAGFAMIAGHIAWLRGDLAGISLAEGALNLNH